MEHAEQILLGCTLDNPDNFRNAVTMGMRADFLTKPEHIELWQVMAELDAEDDDFNIVSVSLRIMNKIGKGERLCVKHTYPNEVLLSVETDSGYKSAAEAVIDEGRRRKVAKALLELSTKIDQGRIHPHEALSMLEQNEYIQMPSSEESDVGEVLDASDEWWNIHEAFLSTNIAEFDRKFKLQRGTLTTIAARSGMGKSSLFLNYVDDALMKGIGVIIISLEMSKEDVIKRLACFRSGVSIDWSRERPDKRELVKFHASELRKQSNLIHVTDKVERNIHQIVAWAKTICKANPGVGLLVLDYIQLVRETPGGGQREQKVAEISRGLRHLSMSAKLAVIGLSQLNSKGLDENPIPSLTNMRESEAIANDSNNVIFIAPTVKGPDGHYRAGGKMWLVCGKQRGGEANWMVPVEFQGWCTRFKDYQDPDAPQPTPTFAAKSAQPRHNLIDNQEVDWLQ